MPDIISLHFHKIAVKTGTGNTYILEDTFTIETGIRPEPWVEVIDRVRILIHKPSAYIVCYGNNGNVDASVVNIRLVFSDVPDLEIDFTWAIYIA